MINDGFGSLSLSPKYWEDLLLTAAMYGHLGDLKIALKNGADINVKNEGSTALHYVAEKGHLALRCK